MYQHKQQQQAGGGGGGGMAEVAALLEIAKVKLAVSKEELRSFLVTL